MGGGGGGGGVEGRGLRLLFIIFLQHCGEKGSGIIGNVCDSFDHRSLTLVSSMLSTGMRMS